MKKSFAAAKEKGRYVYSGLNWVQILIVYLLFQSKIKQIDCLCFVLD